MRGWIGPLVAVFVICVCSIASPSAAEDNESEGCDKSQYTLFNPTPINCMREFEPDHPDQTSNPFTIDAGHVEPETTLFSYLRSSPDNDRTVTDRFSFVSTDIRVGVLNNLELGIEVAPFDVVGMHFADGSGDSWKTGPEALGIATKLNLFGNETFEQPGSTALAILMAIDIPTVRNGVGEEDVQGSVAFPFAIKLSEKSDLELMTKYDFIKNAEGSGYHVEYFNSGSYSYDWTSKLSTYFEVATRFGNDNPSGGIVMLGMGATYQPKANLQLDCGVNIGVTEAADPINPFFGVVKRF
jgi:hypothetical protein